MAGDEKNEIPMLPYTQLKPSDRNFDSRLQMFAARTRSASMSIPTNSMDSYGYETEANLVGHTGPLRNERRTPFIQMSGPLYIKPDNIFCTNQGVTGVKLLENKAEKFHSVNGMDQNYWPDDRFEGKNEHLLRSGQLGMCNDPYCTTCPTYYKPTQSKHSKSSCIFDPKFHNVLYGDAKGWARRFISSLQAYVPGIMNPHTRIVQKWNKFFVISCLVAIFVDPLFFFLLSVQQKNKCIIINSPMTTTMVVFRSMTDIIYFLNILLQLTTKKMQSRRKMRKQETQSRNPKSTKVRDEVEAKQTQNMGTQSRNPKSTKVRDEIDAKQKQNEEARDSKQKQNEEARDAKQKP